MDKHASEASRSLRKVGFHVRSDPTTPFIADRAGEITENGRADLVCVKGGRGVLIEIKSGLTGFQFDQYKPNQREWYKKYCLPEPYQNPLWVWLFIGASPPHYNPSVYQPRKAWLMPVSVLTAVENLIRPIQGTLPYKAVAGMRREIQDHQLDAVTLLKPFGLSWSGGGVWKFPNTHIFTKLYVNSLPLYKETAYEYHLPTLVGALTERADSDRAAAS